MSLQHTAHLPLSSLTLLDRAGGGGTHCGAASSLLQLLGIGLFRVVGDHVGPFAGQGCNVIGPGCIQLSLEATQVQLAPIQPQTGLPPLSQPALSSAFGSVAGSTAAQPAAYCYPIYILKTGALHL